MNPDHDVEKLIEVLRSGSVDEQCGAIADLQQIGATQAGPVLIELLASPAAGVRANAAYALGELGGADAGTPLLAALGDPEPLVRLNAVESLGALRWAGGLAAVQRVLGGDPDRLVRVHAAEALGLLGDRSATPALVAALEDPDETVRAYAADAIGTLGSPEFAPALRARLAVEPSLFARAYLLSASYRLGRDDALKLLITSAAEADDQLAVTILNLAVESSTPQNAENIANLIEDVAKGRAGLQAELDALLGRLRRG